MDYRPDLSFIATLHSELDGFEGFIDSVEYNAASTQYSRGAWLTLSTERAISPQRFWFGCYAQAGKLRYEIKTFDPAKHLDLHHKTLGLSYNRYVGLYLPEAGKPTLWRVRQGPRAFEASGLGPHGDVTISTLERQLLGPSQEGNQRRLLDNCYVQVATRAFRLRLDIERHGVPRFDSFASDALPRLYR